MIKKILSLSLAAAGLLSAGELQPKQLPHDSQWYVHVNAERIAAGGLGQQLATFVESTFNEQYQRLKGFYFLLSPVSELKGVTIYGDATLRGGSVLVNARMNRSQTIAILKGAEGYATEEKAGTTIHTWLVNKIKLRAAFIADDLILFGQNAALFESALATLTGGAKSLETVAAPAAGEAALVRAHANFASMSLPGDISKLASSIKVLNFALNETNDRFSADARLSAGDPEQARAVKSTLEGIIALAAIPQLAQNLTIHVDNSTISVAATIPISQLR